MVPINALIFLLLLIGVFILQVFLSKAEMKWLGLILPSISFLFSLIAALGLAFYGNQLIIQFILQVLMVFLLYNIPTFILLSIYAACRNKLKKKKEMDKMNVQDLE